MIQDREYVWKKGTALVPSFKAFAVVNLLEQHFPDLIDYAFTARMEDDLDEIAGGDEELVPWLSEFYFGPADANGQRAGGLKEKVSTRLDDIDAAAVNAIPIGLDPDGVLIVAKPGRDNSPYLLRGDDTASIPTALAPDELTVEKALELLAAPKGGRVLGDDPATGLPIYAKSGRFGPYVQLGDYDDDSDVKPRMASLFKTMTLERVTPRRRARAALAAAGRRRRPGRRRRDHRPERQVRARTCRSSRPTARRTAAASPPRSSCSPSPSTTPQAIFAQPKLRGGQVAKPPLRELGVDPVSGKPMVIKDGRFGPYVTDGETNASLRKADDVETITDERASELLQDRRDRGPAPEEGGQEGRQEGDEEDGQEGQDRPRRPPAKKAPAKKARGQADGRRSRPRSPPADEPF